MDGCTRRFINDLSQMSKIYSRVISEDTWVWSELGLASFRDV